MASEVELEARLRADSGDIEAIDALYDLCIGRGRWARAATLLEMKAAATDSLAERMAVLLELGRIQTDVLCDPSAAINSYQAVLELDPGHEAALDGLAQLYDQIEDHVRLLEVLERRVELASGVTEQVGHLERMATLFEEMLGDVHRAAETYRDIIARDPGNESARLALHRLDERLR